MSENKFFSQDAGDSNEQRKRVRARGVDFGGKFVVLDLYTETTPLTPAQAKALRRALIKAGKWAEKNQP